jgi:membrane protein
MLLPPERRARRHRCGDMADRSRLMPLFGALIATAATLYAATQTSHPPREERAARGRPGWGKILANTWAELDRDHVSIMAAGIAFYALLSIFPGMSALISVYGLAADPAVIERQLNAISGILPREALTLLSDQLHTLVAAPAGQLGLGLVVSLSITVWSATSATGVLMQALTIAFEEKENRGLVPFYLRAIGLTVGVGLFAVLSLFLIAIVPALIAALPLPELWSDRISLIRWPILAGLVLLALGLVYRVAPARQTPRWHWLSAGTVGAALLWLIGSAGFSFYVARFGSYDKTYGSLGAVVILLMWFYLSAYIVLAGAELNSEIEKARAQR